jgi:hypothetical protein
VPGHFTGEDPQPIAARALRAADEAAREHVALPAAEAPRGLDRLEPRHGGRRLEWQSVAGPRLGHDLTLVAHDHPAVREPLRGHRRGERRGRRSRTLTGPLARPATRPAKYPPLAEPGGPQKRGAIVTA